MLVWVAIASTAMAALIWFQGELFLDPIDEDCSDLESHVQDAEPSTFDSRVRVADAKLALLKSLVLATKFARLALLLQAKRPNKEPGVKVSSL